MIGRQHNDRIFDMKLQKIECFAIWSEDPERLASWYKQTFDLEESLRLNEADDTGVGFEIGGMLLWFGYHSEVKGTSKDPRRFIIEILVDDLKEVYGRLQKAGARIVREPSYAKSIDLWVVTAEDLDGNTIQFLSKEY